MQRVGGEDRGVLLRRISPAAGACFVLLIVALTWAAPIADLTAHTYGLLPAMLV